MLVWLSKASWGRQVSVARVQPTEERGGRGRGREGMVQALEAVSCSLHVNPGAVLPTRRFFHRKLAVVSSPEKENRLLAVFTHWQLIQLVNDRRTQQLINWHMIIDVGLEVYFTGQKQRALETYRPGSVWIIQERRISLHQNC